MPIRRVLTKGRWYLQEVEYHWDPKEKRGVTKVIRHLGPERPANVDRWRDPLLRKARGRFTLEQAARRALNQQSADTESRSEDTTGAVAERPETRPRVARVPTLTPSTRLRAQVKEVLTVMPRGGSRRAVLEEFEKRGLLPLRGREHFATRVGFALTILARTGEATVEGEGVPGDPQVFKVKRPLNGSL